MQHFRKLAGLMLLVVSGTAAATDIVNQDKRAYTITVQGEGKLSTSNHTVRPGGSLYGLCNYSFCTFAIPGHKISATKSDRITIRGGKLVP